jgi:hypothetical protein
VTEVDELEAPAENVFFALPVALRLTSS